MLRRTGAKSQTTVLSGGGISRAPIEATLGWQPTADGLRLAWRTIIDESDDAHLWNAAVDAKTGALLKQGRLDLARQRSTSSRGACSARRRGSWRRPSSPRSWSARRRRCSTARPTASIAWPNESPNDAGRTLVAQPGGLDRLAVRLARHQRRGRRGLRHDAGQQRRTPISTRTPTTRRTSAPARAAAPGCASTSRWTSPSTRRTTARRGGEPVLRQQHDPRRPLPLRLRRPVGQLPGRQLRPRRRRGRLRPRRGAGRQRHQQRQLLHAGRRRRRAAHADVPVAGQPARAAERGSRSRAARPTARPGRASAPVPTTRACPGAR